MVIQWHKTNPAVQVRCLSHAVAIAGAGGTAVNEAEGRLLPRTGVAPLLGAASFGVGFTRYSCATQADHKTSVEHGG